MIYLNNTTEAQVVYVPRDSDLPVGDTVRFTAKSTVDLDTPISALVIDLEMHRIFYNIALSLPEGVAPGEYQYELTAGDEVVSTGLLIIRDAGSPAEEYNKPIEYEQYQS